MNPNAYREHSAAIGRGLAQAAERTIAAMRRLGVALRPAIHRRLDELGTEERAKAFEPVLALLSREGFPVRGTPERMTHWLAFLEGVEHGRREAAGEESAKP